MTAIVTLMLVPGSYFLFSDGLSLEATRSVRALWDLGHVGYFVLLTFIFLKLPFLNHQSFFKRCSIVITLAIIVGVVIEALQYGTARSTDLYDVAHDVLGSLIVLAFYQPIKTLKNAKYLFVFNSAVFLFCIISLWPLVSALWDEGQAKFQFPILTDFSSPLEIKRWSGGAEFSYAPKIDTDFGAMRILFKTKRFSGVSFKYFEHNWTGYSSLNLVIFSDQKKPVLRTLKIYDSMHKTNGYLYSDRFNHRLVVNKGWNTFKIPINDIKYAPKTRIMDLKHVNSLSVFSTRLSKPETLYLKSIYLSQ